MRRPISPINGKQLVIFGWRQGQDVFIFGDSAAAVKQHAFLNDDAGGLDIPDNETCGQENNLGMSPEAAFHHTSDHNRIRFNAALRSTALSNKNSAIGFDISLKVTINTQKTLEIDAAAEICSLSYNGVDESLTFSRFIHTQQMSLYLYRFRLVERRPKSLSEFAMLRNFIGSTNWVPIITS